MAASESDTEVFVDRIDSATILTCNICEFDTCSRSRSRRRSSLSSTPFSHTWTVLVEKNGLAPLKFIGGEYVVIGNLLKEMPDNHVARVVALGFDMICAVNEFNSSSDIPLAIKVGVHTDSL